MRATSLRIPARGDKYLDYDNYCRLVQAVQELLSTQYDGNFFETQQTSSGLVVSGKRPEHGKDNYDLVWNSRREVVVQPGLIWCPFIDGAGSPELQTLVMSAITTLDLRSLGQYLTIYAKADVVVNIDNGCKAVQSSTISACDSGSANVWKMPVDVNVSYPPVSITQYIPLYATSAQVGESTSDFDNFILVHDFRYAPRFTLDVQGLDRQARFVPRPRSGTPNVHDLVEVQNATEPIETGWIPPEW